MIRFTRSEEGSVTETITLVRLDRNRSLAVQVETGTPVSWEKDPNDRAFVGLYDLEGDQISTGNETWEIEEGTAFEGRDAAAFGCPGIPLSLDAARSILMESWESGTSVCEQA